MTGEALVLRAILLLARVTQSPPWIGHLGTQLAPFAEPFPRRRFAAQGPLSDGEAVAGASLWRSPAARAGASGTIFPTICASAPCRRTRAMPRQ
ncbi:hypothetical protein QWZ10_23295 [Paracoccus cavernae]|uniref:Uncharacterized protein n=1 Tax=Paracoccus cavernae TaxID=1571207 RepID=A0ABT8DC11_9RHOB|nr:hypothetical protein [Paracoccus cavernae]